MENIMINDIVKQKITRNKLAFQLSLRYRIIEITEKQITIETIEEDFKGRYFLTYKQFEKSLELVR